MHCTLVLARARGLPAHGAGHTMLGERQAACGCGPAKDVAAAATQAVHARPPAPPAARASFGGSIAAIAPLGIAASVVCKPPIGGWRAAQPVLPAVLSLSCRCLCSW